MRMAFNAGNGSGESRKRKRAPRMTLAQASYLANFMLRNKEFAMRAPTNAGEDKKKKEAWKKLALELNSLTGANKNVDGWKKAWLDLKRTSRLRVTKILKTKGPRVDADKCHISDIDRRVLEAVGIAIKVEDDTQNLSQEDEELTFVNVKESDDSCDFLDTNAIDDQELDYTPDDPSEQFDVKDESLSQLLEAHGSDKLRSGRKLKRFSSCSDKSDVSNESELSVSDDVKIEEKRKGKKKGKKKKSEESLMERVLRDLQDDYTSGLKAIAEAITKISDNRSPPNQVQRSRRVTQPWFHYLKF